MSSEHACREANWANFSMRRLPGVDVQGHAWLRDSGSLTRSIMTTCAQGFGVDLLHQGHGRALPSEADMLGCGPALIREVRLNCGSVAWVFARTLIPVGKLRGPLQALVGLGRRPLGAVLFADPRTRRLRVEVARLTPRHHLFAAATAHLDQLPRELCGRRTLFEYRGQSILVNELFLPAIAELVR